MEKIAIIIPAYNEEKRIRPTLDAYSKFFAANYPNYEILVMVEGDDRTCDIVREFASADSRIKYYYSKARLGKGGAIIEGFKRADGDLIGFVDADCTTTPQSYYDLITGAAGSDGAIASKRVRGAVILKQRPALQVFGAWGLNIIVRCIFSLPFKDTQVGAKIFRRHAIKSVANELKTTNWVFDIDLLYRLRRRGYNIREVPTTWAYKEGATFNFAGKFHTIIPSMVIALLKLRFSKPVK